MLYMFYKIFETILNSDTGNSKALKSHHSHQQKNLHNDKIGQFYLEGLIKQIGEASCNIVLHTTPQ